METLHVICQAHLDPVWLWSWRDGFAEVLTTLRSAVDRLHEFPEMRYSCSSAAFYRWVEETDPRLFKEIRGFIDQGRWEVVGGWVVQADTLLPSEFSLRRQGQLAQDWFHKRLGVTAQIGYCVDSFGHSAGLPSILSAAGMRYYVFQRPDPRERPDLPNLFWWEAPDGARVLTWRLACGYGQGPACAADDLEKGLRGNWRNGMPPGMTVGTWFVGVGNHGGGPTRIQLERLRELRGSNDGQLPELRFSTLAEFFADVERQSNFADIPVIRGELLHHARGCYAANTRFKRLHRQTERELGTAENLLHIQNSTVTPPYERDTEMPPAELHEAWWTLCFNQFHDILPGSSVAPAYDEARDDLGAVRHAARRLSAQAVHTLARRVDTRGAPEGILFMLNPLPWERTAVASVDSFVSPHGDSPITHLTTPDGQRLPLQWTAAEAGFGPFLMEWRKLVAVVPLPASGSRWFHLSHGGDAAAAPSQSAAAAPLLALADSARLVVVDDQADTWGHDVTRWDKTLGHAQMTREKLLDDGPVFRRRRRWLAWGRSTVILDIAEWHPLGAVELTLRINWQDRFHALKLELATPSPLSTLRVRAPGAVVDRPLDGDEWFLGDWLTFESGPRLFAIVSDGVSAYDATAERLRLTLLRCVPHAQFMQIPHSEDSPAPFLDEGWQQARFWLTTPSSSISTEEADRLATGMLTPAEQMIDSAHPPA